ncbi:MAG: TIGR04211 family SH3 domain-containing protein [Desulfamplus sp.]|nr:TIGR04211 family SH3 domain-containing protein [Desulfamplus sp.]
MKTIIINALFLALLALYVSPLNANDEQYYVTQRMEITMRSGPGVSYKIEKLVPSGEAVTMVEYRKEWSKIKAADGKEGWVLSRYVTKEFPSGLVIKELQEKNRLLSATLEEKIKEIQVLKKQIEEQGIIK